MGIFKERSLLTIFIGGLLALLILFAMVALSSRSYAQPQCGEHAATFEIFKKKYNEELVATGLLQDGVFIMEILADPESGTWSVFITNPTVDPSRATCLIAAGQKLQMQEFKQLPGDGGA